MYAVVAVVTRFKNLQSVTDSFDESSAGSLDSCG